MLHRASFAFALGLSLIASNALAASRADLAVSLVAPAGVHVYESGRYDVTVRNGGNRNAADVTLTVQLPPTHTSPTVHVLGDLGPYDARCSLSGARLTCALGTVNRGASKTVSFHVALPYSAAPLTFDAAATTSTAETALANNGARHVAAPLTYAVAVSPPAPVVNRHCTGTGLTSFFECELFPSSISSHETVFNADHSITFLGAPPGYTGAWTQPAPDRLQFQYFEGGALVASFDGRGVDGRCFHGLTTFPGSAYVSPYEVCLP